MIWNLFSVRGLLATSAGALVFLMMLVSYSAEPGYAGVGSKAPGVSEQYLQSQLYFAYKARLEGQAAQQTQENKPAPAPTPPPVSPGGPPT
ncbi:MAG: hypothetical protein SFV17_26845 [Candidatus Obscuribacter sp.]|nr:hypothetical protein [Candidatus Obscuribacter sp.]